MDTQPKIPTLKDSQKPQVKVRGKGSGSALVGAVDADPGDLRVSSEPDGDGPDLAAGDPRLVVQRAALHPGEHDPDRAPAAARLGAMQRAADERVCDSDRWAAARVACAAWGERDGAGAVAR